MYTNLTSILSVSELNALVRDVLEHSTSLLWISGEVSNFTVAASGHWYFSLKDSRAQVRCVMFRTRNLAAEFVPQNGDLIEARVLISLYEPRGEFQVQVEFLQHAGLGALYKTYEALRHQFTREGLFDAGRKRMLPEHPACIGVITSLQAAALQDVLTVLARRAPDIPVIIYPTPVQGSMAPPAIVAALQAANRQQQCDVLVLCRGGGSIEDLWAFNDEAVVRAVADSAIPLVCGVGHETDFTLSDFAADLRAPTPTAAAEMASPDCQVVLRHMQQRHQQLGNMLALKVDRYAQQLLMLGQTLRHHLEQPRSWTIFLQQAEHRMRQWLTHTLNQHQGRLNHLRDLLDQALQHQLCQQQLRLMQMEHSLAHLDPKQVLARGYAIVCDASGNIVRESTTLAVSQSLDIRFAQGGVSACVTQITPERNS